jgi:hypothetical protein
MTVDEAGLERFEAGTVDEARSGHPDYLIELVESGGGR